MSGIFISYRRIDTIAWAGRLFDYLKKSFGISEVFMDIEGSIPRGADFHQVLRNALDNCDCLLALIGPCWINCTRTSGQRRLDDPNDWVRNEIATALRRNIPIFPVLFGNASRPTEAELPGDIRLLTTKQDAQVGDGQRWAFDVDQLINDIVRLTQLKRTDNVASAKTGIELLKDLMVSMPAVADTVSRSKEVIENTYQQIRKLELFKKLHDALHAIEFKCLVPLQAAGSKGQLLRCEEKFIRIAGQIQQASENSDLDSNLRDELDFQLRLTADAFKEAMGTAGGFSYGLVENRLKDLLSDLPTPLNSGISAAAKQMNLTRLIELMRNVHNILGQQIFNHDSAYVTITQSVDSLNASRDELKQRVNEHSRLQGLDSKLRTVSGAGVLPGEVADEWRRIKQRRSRLVQPFSPEFERFTAELSRIEEDIDSAIGQDDERKAEELLRDYSISVSEAFCEADTGLKDFCMRLTVVSQSLRTILDMCASGG